MSAVETTHNKLCEPGTAAERGRLDAFHPAYRRRIFALTSASRELADLADSFPALLFALASGYATADRRARAFDLIGQGAPLRDAADALELPWWLRRLPAHAFTAPLPGLPTDQEFVLRMAGLIPHDTRMVPLWFSKVCQAIEAVGRDFALWVARQPDLAGLPDEQFAVLAAWAWFSPRPALAGHRLLRKPWSTDMSAKRAREELAAWRQRLRLVDCLGLGVDSPWLADGSASGFDFVALRTVEDFISESEALENCLDQYADHLHTGLTSVFSIRKGSRRVGCVEIGPHASEVTMPAIVQLRAARNRRAAPDVWQATFAWLGSQRLEPLSLDRHIPKPLKRAEARRRIWDPYLGFLGRSRHADVLKALIQQSPRWPRPRRALQRRTEAGAPAEETPRREIVRARS